MTIIAQVSDWLKSLACFQLHAFCVQQNRWGGGKIFQNKSINIMIFYCLKKRSKKAEAAEECLFFLKIRILEEVEIICLKS